MYDTYMYILLKQSLFHSNINYIIDKNSNIPAMYNIKTVLNAPHRGHIHLIPNLYIYSTRTQGSRSSTLHFFLLIPLSLNLWNVSTTI